MACLKAQASNPMVGEHVDEGRETGQSLLLKVVVLPLLPHNDIIANHFYKNDNLHLTFL